MSFPEYSNICPACKEEAVEEMEDRGVPFLGCGECFGLFATEDGLEDYVKDSAALRNRLQQGLLVTWSRCPQIAHLNTGQIRAIKMPFFWCG